MKVQHSASVPPPSVMQFTPSGFFAATTRTTTTKMEVVHCGATIACTPTRPPKLMDQPIEMPKKTGSRRRNSRLQEMDGVGQLLTRIRHQAGSQSAAAAIVKHSQAAANNINKQPASAEMATGITATPQRRTAIAGRNQHHLRREHSASIIIPARRTRSTTFMSYTPPATFTTGEDHEIATVFAGSKFIESPSPKSLPLPPLHWLENNRHPGGQKTIAEVPPESGSDAEELAGVESTMAVEDNFVPGSFSPPQAAMKSPSGIRMNPLHLIAAAVMST